MRRVDQHDVGRAVGRGAHRGVTRRERLDHELDPLAYPADLGERFAPMELRTGEAQTIDDLDDALGAFVAEDAHGDDAVREPSHDLGRLIGPDLPAARREHEPERIGAECDRKQRVILVRDPADLDEHVDTLLDASTGHWHVTRRRAGRAGNRRRR